MWPGPDNALKHSQHCNQHDECVSTQSGAIFNRTPDLGVITLAAKHLVAASDGDLSVRWQRQW